MLSIVRAPEPPLTTIVNFWASAPLSYSVVLSHCHDTLTLPPAEVSESSRAAVTDFGANDILDLSDILKGRGTGADVLNVLATDNGMLVRADIDGIFQDVALIQVDQFQPLAADWAHNQILA